MRTSLAVPRSGLSLRLLAWLCALLLAAGTLPLYALSLYNHPYYDDFGFSAQVHATWRQTRSLPATLQAALQSAQKSGPPGRALYRHALSSVSPASSPKACTFSPRFLLTAFCCASGFC